MNYVVNDELRQLIQQVTLQHMNAFQPRPRKGRRPRPRPAASSPDAPDAYRAVATTTCTASVLLSADRVQPGVGFATLYVPPSDTSIGGSPWTPGETNVLYENWEPSTVAIGSKILLRKTRDNPVTQGILYELIETESSASEDIRGVSYQTITAATGTISGPITPGFGLARLYTAPTGPAGTPWQIQSSPVTVENWMFATVVPQKPILLRKGRTAADGSQIYCVIAEGCKEITSG